MTSADESVPASTRLDSARPEPYEAVELIRTKRDGGRLSDAEVDWVIDAYTRGVIAEEQMSAMTMAIDRKSVV